MFGSYLALQKQATLLSRLSVATRWLSSAPRAAAAATSASVPTTSSNTPSRAPKNWKTVHWKLYAHFHRHNTLCSMVAVQEDLNFMKNNEHLSYNEKVIYYLTLPHHIKAHVSAGMLGFRKSNRAEYEAAYQVSSRIFKLIEERKLLAPNDQVELILKDFGRGREAFMSALQGKEGAHVRPHIMRITDATKIKYGGVRSKKLRRL